MRNGNVLISGGGIGGPALAHWLVRAGFTVTVVEKAPAPRPGGQAVDFKGETHFTVLTRMGVLDDVRRLRTGGVDQEIVDAAGRRLAVMSGEFTGGDLEIRRGDLSRVLYERTAPHCEYLFGDSITSLTDTRNGVHVTFERSAPRTFDLVVGADGIHSSVRRLAFGPEADFVRHLGYHYALAEVDEDFGPPSMYNEPGRMVAVGGPKSPAFFVFASEPLDYDRYDAGQQKDILARAYAGMGWRTPEIINAVRRSGDVYLDSLSQVRIDRYSAGRVVLLGDAAYGNTLGGFGTGLAMVGAYVLAGELAEAAGDHRAAFAAYERHMRPYAKIAENGNAGPFMAPPTKARMWARNLVFRSSFLLRMMIKMGDSFATDIDLKDYPALTK
ncbi:2-polyprenyl-6-methoxyphenol hydroxylase [Nonomuraea maritima]|uniref:2-polyprenyl-6-methoxyphenol hydroxylase n=1 Tax=Nonomuraea maritima TaxID=683260 RepID=A0A1G9E0W5_9ACTN|nr:FAD-dependent monooxygenase [Nonomuraea maritima]SDK69728.1 2-polyprenyl-6-methoxyphenol hydroxylase [Nonomuraea maritima]